MFSNEGYLFFFTVISFVFSVNKQVVTLQIFLNTRFNKIFAKLPDCRSNIWDLQVSLLNLFFSLSSVLLVQ